jgi:hypothetical protein
MTRRQYKITRCNILQTDLQSSPHDLQCNVTPPYRWRPLLSCWYPCNHESKGVDAREERNHCERRLMPWIQMNILIWLLLWCFIHVHDIIPCFSKRFDLSQIITPIIDNRNLIVQNSSIITYFFQKYHRVKANVWWFFMQVREVRVWLTAAI